MRIPDQLLHCRYDVYLTLLHCRYDVYLTLQVADAIYVVCELSSKHTVGVALVAVDRIRSEGGRARARGVRGR